MMSALTPQHAEILDELKNEGAKYDHYTTSEGFTFRSQRKAEDFANDDEKRRWLSATLNAYVNVLRPRLKQLLQSR